MLSTGITVTGTLYTAAADDLHRQMPEFNFVTYKTSDNGLHLTSGTQANDAWTLTHEDAALTYTVSPFFADAFALSSSNAPGTASKPYQVRSIEQLQYINWSYINGQGSTTRDVTGSNSDYKYYPYLQYTNRRGNALQTKAMALAGDSTGGPRPILTWQQTHDLNGAGHGTAADGTAANYDFHPIAGAVNNGQLNDRGNETYDLTLYNWFGGIYDGGNYYIKNVNITSHCYNVGLFGTTAGAEIKNIVLYSDNDAVIQRKTDATPASGATGPENYATSYALGGLVGIAYDYDENLKDKTKVSTISNCAIAGYTVTDNSKNRQFLGEAAIGGLVGVSSANLNRCSAVVKLNINCTHRYASEGAMNKAQWGNYVRVGGLVGGVRYDVSDCYTGGSITVANDLLNERIPTDDSTNTIFVDRYETTPKSVKMTQGGAEAGPDTYVYIGGIGGSGFSATFSNFSGSKDGQPTYNNCYTYVTFPAMEGTITGISLIGSIADRAGVSGGTARLTINNCYYLDSSAAISFDNLPTFYGKSTQSNGQYTYYSLSTLLSTDTARMDMLRGDLGYLSKYTWNTGSSPYTINGLRALSYEQMSGRADIDGKSFTALLNGGSDDGSFHWVTTEENGQSAHGKYSFPGSAAALLGQDYPFPTVLTQGTACLHYGEWPSRGLYWSSGVLSLDRITTPSVTLSLHFTQDTDADAVPVITCSRKGIVDISAPQAQTPPADVRHSYTVTLTGLKVGSTEVFATLDGYTARLLVSVTSTLDISVDGLPGDDFFVGDTCNLTLTARDSRGSALDVKWTVTPQHGNSVLTASVPVTKADRTASVTLTAASEGEDRTLITAAYTTPGGETFTSQLPSLSPSACTACWESPTPPANPQSTGRASWIGTARPSRTTCPPARRTPTAPPTPVPSCTCTAGAAPPPLTVSPSPASPSKAAPTPRSTSPAHARLQRRGHLRPPSRRVPRRERRLPRHRGHTGKGHHQRLHLPSPDGQGAQPRPDHPHRHIDGRRKPHLHPLHPLHADGGGHPGDRHPPGGWAGAPPVCPLRLRPLGGGPQTAAGGPQHPRGRYQLDAGHHPAAVCRHGLHRRAQNDGQRRCPHRPGRRYPRFRQQGP